MENQITEALTKDIQDMLECVTEDERWNGDNLEFFEYEFLIDRNGQLIYEKWRDSTIEESFIEMKDCPQFKHLKELGYTGVCLVRFYESDTLITREDAENGLILEVALSNSSYHSANTGDKITDTEILAGGYVENERYFFPLTEELKLTVEV